MVEYGNLVQDPISNLYIKNRTNFQNIHLNILLGLILILGSIFIFNEHTPSIFTILPVAGTCLLILFLPQKHSQLIFKNKFILGLFLQSLSYTLSIFFIIKLFLVELNSVTLLSY